MSIVLKLGYLELSIEDIESSIKYYNDVFGASLSETTADGASYLSLSQSDHCIVLKPGARTSLGAVGLQLRAPATLADAAKRIEALGLAVATRTDSRPGIARLLEVTLPGGHVFELYENVTMGDSAYTNCGISPDRLGHVAILSTEARKLISFLCDGLGCWATDWFEDRATFMTCNRDHHVFNVLDAPINGLHHVAFQLRDAGHHFEAADRLAVAKIPVLWGPSRHTAGHNIAAYHRAPEGSLIELYSDMDVFVPELGIFEPRPYHEDRPQKPRIWPLSELTAWHTDFGFDLARG